MGDILFRPTTQKIDPVADPVYQPAAFSHEDEKASAGYYSVILKEEGIKVELTATTHVGGCTAIHSLPAKRRLLS